MATLGSTRRRATFPLLGLASLLALASCDGFSLNFFARSDNATSRFEETAQDPIDLGLGSSYTFLVVGDPHFGALLGASDAVLARFKALVASRSDAFILYAGDDADTGQASQYASFRAWADGLADASGVVRPWYTAVGNHDLLNDGWAYFKEYLYDTAPLRGASYLVLEAGAYDIYIVDTADASLGSEQYARLASDMAADAKPKMVLSHYPIRGSSLLSYYRLTDPTERAKLVELFGTSDVRQIFGGHWHYYMHESYGSLFEEWLVDSLTYTDSDNLVHCYGVTVDGTSSTVERLSF